MLPRQLEEQILSLEVSWSYDIMTVLLMTPLLIESDETPAQETD